jgi:uncharacterized protein YciI
MKSMASFFILILVIFCGGRVSAQNASGGPVPEGKLKEYFFVMLTKGPHRDQDSVKAGHILEQHLANIRRLAKEGKIVLAGPFGDEGYWQGIFIFNCRSKEETLGLLRTDPAIRAGRLRYEVHPWWTATNCLFK